MSVLILFNGLLIHGDGGDAYLRRGEGFPSECLLSGGEVGNIPPSPLLLLFQKSCSEDGAMGEGGVDVLLDLAAVAAVVIAGDVVVGAVDASSAADGDWNKSKCWY